jgi:hypothetical protein
MSISSVPDLQTKLEKEVTWRKKEIIEFKLMASQAEQEPYHVTRAGLVLLCAHWEGYLKKSIQRYVEHVLAQRLRLRDIAPTFVANIYFKDVKKAAESTYPGSEEHHIRLAKRILKGLDEICEPPTWEVTTEANPGTPTMEKILRSVGLDHKLGMDAAEWSTMKVFIDEQVLQDRHKIAHGEYHRIDKGEFIKRSDRLLVLLDRLTDSIMRAAINREYFASTSTQPPVPPS